MKPLSSVASSMAMARLKNYNKNKTFDIRVGTNESKSP
ncbi:hypothetical protein CMALT430_40036 [Carnobacterium maltaromaticum]|nr:hypothetical protein CMALT430_40036 [Carnobacterium maltaromaticum]